MGASQQLEGEEGAILVIADINESKARHAAQRIAEHSGAAMACRVDIGDDSSVSTLAAEVDAQQGRCEILVNNADISDGTGIETMSMAPYHEVTRANQDGAVRMCFTLRAAAQDGDGRQAHPSSRRATRKRQADRSDPPALIKARRSNLPA